MEKRRSEGVNNSKLKEARAEMGPGGDSRLIGGASGLDQIIRKDIGWSVTVLK